MKYSKRVCILVLDIRMQALFCFIGYYGESCAGFFVLTVQTSSGPPFLTSFRYWLGVIPFFW